MEKEENEFNLHIWNTAFEDWYISVKNDTMLGFGSNVIEDHFIFYSLYKLVENEEKALEHVKKAHRIYIKCTLSYQWEAIVYKALREIYSVIPNCVLPNGRLPDLVVNPTYSQYKYHPKGWKITFADKIIDMKTSAYQPLKEKKNYKQYCNELIIIYIRDSKKAKDEEIIYISANELKTMISNQETIRSIDEVQMKMDINFMIENFNERFNNRNGGEDL